MNWKGWTLFAIILALAGAITAFILVANDTPPSAPVVEEEVPNLEGQNLYASGEYGFTLRYPASARLEEAFSAEYHLAPTWRASAREDTGTPVLALVAYETESDSSYPRYYRALVRLGVSDDAADVSSCESVTPDSGEEALADVVLNGTTWSAFSFADAGMQQYVKGVSYRTVHNGKCYALEKIAAGSSYRDDPESGSDIPDEELDAEYAQLDAIVSTFTFSAP